MSFVPPVRPLASPFPALRFVTAFAEHVFLDDLANPDEQSYVRNFLPDSVSGIASMFSTLRRGESILIEDSVMMPTRIKVDAPNPAPESDMHPSTRHGTKRRKKWISQKFSKLGGIRRSFLNTKSADQIGSQKFHEHERRDPKTC